AAKLLGDAKGDKVTVFKYRNKSGYAAKTGHRQLYSLIEITSIGGNGAAEPAPPEPELATADTPPAAEPAPPEPEPATADTPPASAWGAGATTRSSPGPTAPCATTSAEVATS